MIHIGIDMHKRSSEVAAIDDAGTILDRRTLRHDQRAAMTEFFTRFSGQAVATVEAMRSWYWLYEELESCGLAVKLAHPLKVRIIAEAKVKTDKIDALTLAKLERSDFLPESYIPSREIRDQREILRCRVALVRARTIFKNRVHAVLDKLGILHKYTDLFGTQGLEFLKMVELRPVYRQELNEYLAVLEFLELRITEVTKLARATLKEDPRVKRLLTIPGVGELTAYTLLSEIGEIGRFSDARKLCSYAGITPIVRQSGEHRWEGHITKQGNRCLRWIMVEAAQQAPRFDPALRYFYDQIAERRGPKKARVAVARKLLIAVWHILTYDQDYRYNYLAKYQRS